MLINKLISYGKVAKPAINYEYFARKHSISSVKNRDQNNKYRRDKAVGSLSHERFRPNLSISIPDEDSKDENYAKIENNFKSPSLKSIKISILGSKAQPNTKKRNDAMKKYMNFTRIKNPKLNADYSIKTFGKMEKSNTTKSIKVDSKKYPISKPITKAVPEVQKLKSTSQKRLNDSIFTSLNNARKSLRSHALQENKAQSKSPKRIKSNSLHTITIDLPM